MTSKKIVRVTDLLAGNNKRPGIGPTARVFGRDEYGERYTVDVDGVYPYFYVPRSEYVNESLGSVVGVNESTDTFENRGFKDENGRPLKTLTHKGFKSFEGEELTQVVMDQPRDVGEYREQFRETYEADVPYQRRLAVDEGLSGYIEVPENTNGDAVHIDMIDTDVRPDESIEPRILFCDIESVPPTENMVFEKYVNTAPNEILCFTTFDSYSEEYLISVVDPEDEVNGPGIKHYLSDHWNDDAQRQNVENLTIRLQKHPNESSLLTSLIQEFKDKRPDVASGWNFDSFDWKYILRRCSYYENWSVNQHDLSDNGYVKDLEYVRDYKKAVQGVPAFDMLEGVCDKMTYGQWESKSLNYVANEYLDTGKIEDINIMNEYDKNRNKFLAYNLIDVQLCIGIDGVTGVHEFFYTLTDTCSAAITDIWSEMRLVDSYLLSKRGVQEILPTSEELDIDEIPGGFVLTPDTGLHEWIGVLDLKSLYPSTIITCNISPETLTFDKNEADVTVPDMPLNDEKVKGDTVTPNDIGWDLQDGAVGYSLSQQGIIPKYIQGLFSLRDRFKQQMFDADDGSDLEQRYDDQQYSIKVVMNSFFGVLASPYFRLSVEGLAKSITSASRYVNWAGQDHLGNEGAKVNYSDTDSVFIDLNSGSDDIQSHVDSLASRATELNEIMDTVASHMGIQGEHPYITEVLHGTDKQAWVWEAEKLYRRMIQTAKKTYAGLVVWDDDEGVRDEPKLDVVGMASVRSNVPNVGSYVQENVLKKVLSGADFEDISDYLKPIVESIRNYQESDIEFSDIAVPGVLNKSPEEYPNRPCPRGVMYTNKHLSYHFEEGDNPYWVWVKSVPDDKPKTDVIALPWYTDLIPGDFELDSEKHIKKYVKGPLEDILMELNWDFNRLAEGRRASTIDVEDTNSNPFK